MKLTSVFNDFTNTDFYLFGLFLLYLVIPFRTPKFIYDFLVNPIGLIFLLSTVLFMFFTTPSILAILYVLVVYELLRRDGSDRIKHRKNKQANHSEDQQYEYVTDPISVESVNSPANIEEEPMKQSQIEEPKKQPLVLPVGDSLEEVMVNEMAPLEYGISNGNDNFKPVIQNKLGGSAF